MHKTHLKSFLHGSAVTMLGVGILGLVNYFIRRTLALNLSETDYGFFYSAYAVVMLIMVFLDAGLSQSSVIFMSKSFAENNIQDSREVFTLVFLSKLFMAVAFFLLIQAVIPQLSEHYFGYPGSFIMLSLIFLLIPCSALEITLLSVLGARKAFTTKQILLNLKAFIILAGILLFIGDFGLKACIISFILSALLISIINFLVIRNYGVTFISLAQIHHFSLKKIFSFSRWIALSSAGISIMYYMDTICLTWLIDLKSVAMYNIALPIMQIAQSFFVFPMVFTPFVSEMSHKKDYTAIRKSCYSADLLMLLTLPVFLLAGIYLAPDIITILFTAKYASAAPAVTILWCGMVFFSIASFNIRALNSGNQQKLAACLVILCVIINFVLNVIMIPKLDYFGAAGATAVSYFIMAAGSVICLRKVTGNP
jgi:O-antigen/teichoic acid export membrane protein